MFLGMKVSMLLKIRLFHCADLFLSHIYLLTGRVLVCTNEFAEDVTSWVEGFRNCVSPGDTSRASFVSFLPCAPSSLPCVPSAQLCDDPDALSSSQVCRDGHDDDHQSWSSMMRNMTTTEMAAAASLERDHRHRR